ncbi:hypothetical protein OGM63_25020 [Plectonema radiosum NIES-515]|uniref:Group 1 glycosyl transferase n=1 Tax=Plectonema radiosum NIES-515 TaxID=2986073 RepID=A0ABT3B5S0_9CYAN|nr:hypothetical protein [Plectonema radiosum]MCV3216727.1 hypothetical protein [Plectonema radiosum NIES-515]
MINKNWLHKLISIQEELDSRQSKILENQAELDRKYLFATVPDALTDNVEHTLTDNVEHTLTDNVEHTLTDNVEHTVTNNVKDFWHHQRFPHLKPLQVFSVSFLERRINLVTDSINSGSLYGGVGTAIIFCTLLAKEWDCKLRVITRTEKADEKNFFDVLTANSISCNQNVEFIFASIFESSDHDIDVCERDTFVTTSWWTTWSTIQSISTEKIVYLLQEDERMFYPHGDEHIRCTQILSNTEIQFVVNSQLLFDHLIYDGFYNIKTKGLYFEPSFSKNLYYPESIERKDAKKNFFFYARPNNLRNLFYFGLEVIEAAVYRGILDIDEWELFFVGKDIPQLKIAGFYEPKRIEGLTWSEYAKFIRSVDLGLCLMYTPHPSYPPLDLAASGSVVVTNRFGLKKELDIYSKNIICKDCNLESILQGISEGIKISHDQVYRSKNCEENSILQDWKISFKDVVKHFGVN